MRRVFWHGIVLAVTLPTLWVYRAHGHDWGDDFAMYLIQALRLTGQWPLEGTGYLFNDLRPTVGPSEYPVGFPLLLAPVVAAAGNDMRVIQPWVFGLFLLFYQALFAFSAKAIRSIPALTLTAAIAWHPFMLDFKNEVMSDVPFVALCLLAMLALRQENLLATLSATVFAVWAVLTREAGIALAVGLIAYASVRAVSNAICIRDAVRMPSAVAGASGAMAYVVNSLVYPGGYGSHFKDFRWLDVVQGNAYYLWEVSAYQLCRLWYDTHHGLAMGLIAMIAVLAAAGFLTDVRKRLRPEHVVALAFLAVFLLFPFSSRGFRFTLPFLPLLGCMAMLGAQRLPRYGSAISILLPLTILALNNEELQRMRGIGPFTPPGPQYPQSEEVFRFIREKTSPECRVLFAKPRALALYAHRYAMCAPDDSLSHRMDGQLRDLGITHVLVGADLPDPVTEQWLAANANATEAVLTNSHFTLMAVRHQ